MIDILFLAHNRLEFTIASAEALIANTDWSQVRLVRVHDDGSTDGTREYLESLEWPADREFRFKRLGGPVAIMSAYMTDHPGQDFAKIDNDVLVPPGWLGECLDVMDAHPELQLLGIECGNDFPVPAPHKRGYEPAIHIGGIGLMRGNVFKRLGHPKADGRFGFTEWQHAHNSVVKGWINPPLPVALLDHLPFQPWRALSERYIRQGWQRKAWGYYEERSHRLWDWWKGARQETAA